MAIGAKELNPKNEAPDNRRAVPTLGGGAKVAAALEHAVKASLAVASRGSVVGHRHDIPSSMLPQNPHVGLWARSPP